MFRIITLSNGERTEEPMGPKDPILPGRYRLEIPGKENVEMVIRARPKDYCETPEYIQ